MDRGASGAELSDRHVGSVGRAGEVLAAAFDPAVLAAARASMADGSHPDGDAYLVRGILWMAQDV